MPVGNMDENLTITTTKQSLYTLLSAINANAPRNVALIEITGDDGQTANVFIGGYNLADNDYAFKLTNAGDIFEDKADWNIISITQIYLKVIAAGADQTVHCRVRVR